MRRGIVILIILLVLLIGGGGLTSQLLSEAPIIVQSSDPNASVFEATPEQANQFIFWAGFVLFNLLAAALTFMVIMWRGNVEVKKAQQMPNRETQSDALPEPTSE